MNFQYFNKAGSLLWKALKKLIFISGIFGLLFIILSFTSLPFWAHYYLGISSEPLEENPDVMVVLGGSGMPSSESLMRTYYASEAALKFPEARIIIALPGDTIEPLSSVRLMARELVLHGVDSSRISYENIGTNTRWEALNIKQRFYPDSSPVVLLVTSPAHIYRSVRTFQKAGFEKVGGLASFGKAHEDALEFDAAELGGQFGVPDVGNQMGLRYAVWSRLHIQISVFREYIAIAYYWLMGWI
jgi:uncharacterized SAM-binding protein YcdF (DUF218 family)